MWVRGWRRPLQSDVWHRDSFAGFVEAHEESLRLALIANLGGERGREAASHALLWGLENWDRLSGLENPVGYLFRVGQRWSRRQRSRRVVLFDTPGRADPWVEPDLIPALEALPAKQRMAVVLRHGADWSYQRISEVTGMSQDSARKNVQRGLSTLRKRLGGDHG